jgi:CyaY protein
MLEITEFNERVDLLFDRIIDTIDAADADIDVELNQGVLEVTCANDTQIIVNRHEPNREIWIAAKSGGFHFKWTSEAWLDTRSGEALDAALTRVFLDQTGKTLKF